VHNIKKPLRASIALLGHKVVPHVGNILKLKTKHTSVKQAVFRKHYLRHGQQTVRLIYLGVLQQEVGPREREGLCACSDKHGSPKQHLSVADTVSMSTAHCNPRRTCFDRLVPAVPSRCRKQAVTSRATISSVDGMQKRWTQTCAMFVPVTLGK
jgi:hypothetical protein